MNDQRCVTKGSQEHGERQGMLLMHGELVALHYELIKSIDMVIQVANPFGLAFILSLTQ